MTKLNGASLKYPFSQALSVASDRELFYVLVQYTRRVVLAKRTVLSLGSLRLDSWIRNTSQPASGSSVNAGHVPLPEKRDHSVLEESV
jgi:hypothetical protein